LLIRTNGERVAPGGGVANRVYEVGVTVVPGQRGPGYGAEAQRSLADHLFTTYPIARV